MRKRMFLWIFLGVLVILFAILLLLPSENQLTQTGEVVSLLEYDDYVDISPQEAKILIDNNPSLVVIDVSSAYSNGHLPGAINYYVGDGSLDEAIPTLDSELPYLVYCHFDSASISGAQKLVDAGFKKVYRLEGNYRAWVDAGYEIEY